MNNKELISKLSEKLDVTTQETTDMLSALAELFCTKLADNDSIYLTPLGIFDVRKRGERVSVNPVSGIRFLVPPKLVPTFKPGTLLKEKLKEIESYE